MHKIFIACFLGLLLLPGVVWMTGWKDKTISFENRKGAVYPKFEVTNLDPFPPKYEAWYNDHFPARNSLLFGYNYVFARYFRKSPKPEMVAIGKEGWFYMANNEMNVYTGKMRFSEGDLKKMLMEIVYRQQQCANHGVEYRVVVIPCKQTVYPEYLPDFVVRYPGMNATDQFVDYMQQHSSLKILDLRSEIKNCKKYGPMYIKGDNHWSELGTFFAYRAIVNWLSETYPIGPPLEFGQVSVHDTLTRGGNIRDMIGMADLWKDIRNKVVPCVSPKSFPGPKSNYPVPELFAYPWEYELPFRNKDSNLPGLLVIRESFTNELMRNLLSSHFGRSTYIWDKWEHRLNLNIVKEEKPKLVLCMVVESLINCFEEYPDAPVAPKN